MKLYARVKINGKWTYRSLDTKETRLHILIAKEGWTWNDE
tara:strand:+ start:1191 stop:1310 length:120 start_codon:yes stop_codon:yes gene_type:complete